MKNECKKCHILEFLVITLIILIIASVFSVMYVYNEDRVYVYDYIGYQLRLDYLTSIFKDGLMVFFQDLYLSIRTMDYNYFPILFLVPLQLIFGTGRLVYILGMTVIYYVPLVILLLFYIFKKLDLFKNKDYLLKVAFIIFIFTFTGFWSSMLRGLPDIIGLIPMVLLMLNFKSYNEKLSVTRLIINGVLIYLPFLCRRWYAYSMIGIYFSIFIVSLLSMEKINKKNILMLIKNTLISGIVTSLCVIIFQTPLFLRILNSRYDNSYSAYQVDFGTHLVNFYGEYGLLVIILALFGILGCIFKYKNDRNYLCIYSFLNIFVFVFLFTNVQMFGVHHFLGISLYLCILSLYGIYYLYKFFNKKLGNVFLIFVIFLSVVNFSTTYIFRDKDIPLISQNHKYYKFRYSNYSNLLQFVDDLSNLISSDYGKISFFASTENISDSLVDTLADKVVKSNLYYTSNIDLRDGLNYNSLLYKYVVVTSRTEVGTNVNGQQVLAYPNYLIFNNKGIGVNYKKVLGPYILQDDVEVYVYEKVGKFSDDDIDSYLNYFYGLYPEWEKDVSIFDRAILCGKIIYGDKLGDFRRLDNKTYYMHPGYTSTSASFEIKDTNYKSLKLIFNLDKIAPSGTKTHVIIKNNKDIVFNDSIDFDEKQEVLLELKGKNDIFIEIDYGEEFAYDGLYMEYVFE